MRCKSEFERWNDKVFRTDYCWEWIGAKYRNGYGHFRRFIDGKWKMYKAHRFSVEYFNNADIPKGKMICHHCDNPSCVNPDHLYIGDAKTNARDCSIRGRKNYGVKEGHKKLTEQEIIEMRQLYEKGIRQRDIADMMGISRPQVCRVVNNKIHSRVKHAGG